MDGSGTISSWTYFQAFKVREIWKGNHYTDILFLKQSQTIRQWLIRDQCWWFTTLVRPRSDLLTYQIWQHKHKMICPSLQFSEFQHQNFLFFSIALGQFPLVTFAHSHLGVSVTARGRWSLSSSNVFSACCNARCARASGGVGFRTGFLSFFTPASTYMGGFCHPEKVRYKLRFGIFLPYTKRCFLVGLIKCRTWVTSFVGPMWFILRGFAAVGQTFS